MTPGSLYRVGGQTFLDSQAIYNLAREHEVVGTAGGWRVFVNGTRHPSAAAYTPRTRLQHRVNQRARIHARRKAMP